MVKVNKANKVEANKVEVKQFDLTSYTTKSSKIRFLASQGLTRSQIVKYFKEILNDEIIYQHVRNVLTQPLKKQA